MAQSRESTSSEQSGSSTSGSGMSASGSGDQNRDTAMGGSTSGGGTGGGGTSGNSLAGQGTEMIGQAQDQAMKLVGTAREQVTSQISSQFTAQQQHLASTLNTVATALHDASREMRNQDEAMIAGYVDTAASQVEHLANTLREQDLEQLMNTTAQFARRQPALFLGAAFAVGFAVTRFLKSSSQTSGQMSSRDSGLWYDRPEGFDSGSYGSGYGYAGGVSDLGYGGGRLSTERMGVSGTAGLSEGMGSSGTGGFGSSIGSSGTGGSRGSMGSSGTMGSSDFGGASGSSGTHGTSGSAGASASSGSGSSSASGGSSGSGGSMGSGSQSGSASGSGSSSKSGGQSGSNTGSGAGGQ